VAREPLHALDQIPFGRLDDQMKIIPHQTEGMDLPIRLDASFVQGFKETLPVGVIAEDGFAPIPAIQDVTNRPFVFNAQRSWHGVITQNHQSVSMVRTDPFTRSEGAAPGLWHRRGGPTSSARPERR